MPYIYIFSIDKTLFEKSSCTIVWIVHFGKQMGNINAYWQTIKVLGNVI
jgi:hypothetical protein